MRNNFINYAFLLVLTLWSVACNQGSQIENLSEKYIYHDGGGDYRDIIKVKNVTSNTKISNLNYIKCNVYSKVIDYRFNNDFIVIAQIPNKEWHVKAIAFELEDIYSKKMSRSIADSLIKNDIYYQKIFSRDKNYWIVNNKEDSLLGPFSKHEYFQKKIELKVPEELKLKDLN